ncbi:hypothetical protein CAOG_07729 [Capsaspora owczarzaki ATCC 30864]|uniref:Uncharacterized protein n=1 Tax=Capsaspora owczarzaki (strain ATCC 30864) TaxID=595528 RepID=A0A0D2WX37_CAPO3|nr:hypothetical protein CAOG_07729 [Capsaspora owczarzaki ATCC 30864]KJE97298.1 hypothetical protein CAOG_007729 [Capsaspora owczarzaki ATCC 30864]|eukprot:XP_004343603.1 hypothetical protein CAOG_07729 [Capsaspora owczarzaki ATCC 30864]
MLSSLRPFASSVLATAPRLSKSTSATKTRSFAALAFRGATATRITVPNGTVVDRAFQQRTSMPIARRSLSVLTQGQARAATENAAASTSHASSSAVQASAVEMSATQASNNSANQAAPLPVPAHLKAADEQQQYLALKHPLLQELFQVEWKLPSLRKHLLMALATNPPSTQNEVDDLVCEIRKFSSQSSAGDVAKAHASSMANKDETHIVKRARLAVERLLESIKAWLRTLEERLDDCFVRSFDPRAWTVEIGSHQLRVGYCFDLTLLDVHALDAPPTVLCTVGTALDPAGNVGWMAWVLQRQASDAS